MAREGLLEEVTFMVNECGLNDKMMSGENNPGRGKISKLNINPLSLRNRRRPVKLEFIGA